MEIGHASPQRVKLDAQTLFQQDGISAAPAISRSGCALGRHLRSFLWTLSLRRIADSATLLDCKLSVPFQVSGQDRGGKCE
jgi:hypothetical protein